MFKKKFSHNNILQHYPYIGSTNDRIIHSTKNPCENTFLIEVNTRWYTRSVPTKSGYLKCNTCFSEEER